MLGSSRIRSVAIFFAFFFPPLSALAQTSPKPTAILRAVDFDGANTLQSDQLRQLTGLQLDAQTGRDDLQSAADKLVASGLFSDVQYDFKTRAEGLSVTFHLKENPRIPAYYDNFPWFGDSELSGAIRAKLPFFDGTLPTAGFVVEEAAAAITEFLSSHNLTLNVEHQVVANPSGDGDVQQFHVEGAGHSIASLQFSDPSLSSSKAVQQHLSEVVGKPYSRAVIDLFLTEQIRPVYMKQGFLHAKLGPPEVRLTGNPNQKLPDQLPIFIPVVPGPVYRWASAEWHGNSAFSSITLSSLLGLKQGDPADGMQIEAGWDRAREEYGQRGYLESKIEPVASYDEQAHSVSYKITIAEGVQYRLSSLVLTGVSAAADRIIHESFPVAPGAVFDKAKYEEFLTTLQTHPQRIFKDLPVHYETVGHLLSTDASKATVDVLLDFK